MKKLVLVSTLLIACAAYGSSQREADIDRLQTSGVILGQIMSAPDHAIPDAILDGAKCIAIVPSMLKASFIFGANYGKGVATCRTETGWSAPVFFKVEGGSFGFQAGGEASDLVLIIRTEDGMQHLLSSKFKLGGDASAAAGPVGREAQAMTDLTLRAQVLTYSRARGLFAGIAVNGAVIHQAEGDTQAFYRKPLTFRTILSGETPAPKEAESFLKMVEKYAPTPHVRTPATASVTPAESAAPADPTTTTAPVASAIPTTAPASDSATPDATNATASANSDDDQSGMVMAPEAQPAQTQPAGNAAPTQSATPATTTKPVPNESAAPIPPPTSN